MQYVFKSERLGFRNWVESDKSKMAEINSDPKVMEYFPSTYSFKHTEGFIERMQKQFDEKGFCFFAVDKLSTNEFIGFIGISELTFESEFTPCVDIGWRLAQTEWGNGYATEGAKKCLDYAFTTLGMETITSICPIKNQKSESIMEKLKMTKTLYFKHPLLKDYKDLEECVLYKIERS